jgi:hypothetical protein
LDTHSGRSLTGKERRMKRSILLLVVSLALLTVASGQADADNSRTLNGRYNWEQRGSSGDLEAVFTPVGEMQWEVDFHFDFRGKPHTYSGNAQGELTAQGKLRGEVRNESGKRSFTFDGTFDEQGRFSGTHTETTGGSRVDTGTLTLSLG